MTKPDINQTKIDLKDLKKLQTDLKRLQDYEAARVYFVDPRENEDCFDDFLNIVKVENYLKRLIDQEKTQAKSNEAQQSTSVSK